MYNTPLLDLIHTAANVHRMYNDPAMVRSIKMIRTTAGACFMSYSACTGWCLLRRELGCRVACMFTGFAHMQVQRCTLLSIKTGGCPETCNYCSQSSSWSKETGTKAEKLMNLDDVYQVPHRPAAPTCYSSSASLSFSATSRSLRHLASGPCAFHSRWRPHQCCRLPCAPRTLAARGFAWGRRGVGPRKLERASGSECWRWSGERALPPRPSLPAQLCCLPCKRANSLPFCCGQAGAFPCCAMPWTSGFCC